MLKLLRDTDGHIKETKIVNFDIIHRMCRGEEVPKSLLKECQTLTDEAVSKYLESDQNKILSSAFRTDREDICFEKKKATKKHFANDKDLKNKAAVKKNFKKKRSKAFIL